MRFRSRWRELFEGDPSKKRLYRDVSNGVPAAGIEYYLPLFFESTATIFDYLPSSSESGCTLALHGEVSSAINDFWRDIHGHPPTGTPVPVSIADERFLSHYGPMCTKIAATFKGEDIYYSAFVGVHAELKWSDWWSYDASTLSTMHKSTSSRTC